MGRKASRCPSLSPIWVLGLLPESAGLVSAKGNISFCPGPAGSAHTHLGEITGMDRRSPKELLSLHRTWNGTGNRVQTHVLLLTKKNKKPWKAWQNSLNLSNPGHSKTCGVTFNPVPFDNPGKTALASLFILAQRSNHPFQGFLTKSYIELMKKTSEQRA